MPNTSHSNVLITGGGGMLAAAFARSLRARGIEPRVLRKSDLDITDENAVEELLISNHFTLLINCAAYTKVDLAEREIDRSIAVNGEALRILSTHAFIHSCTLVHFSTDYVFDGSLSRPLRPNDPVGPVSAYGKSKLLGERMWREFGDHTGMIIRTSWLYGPNGPNFVQTMLNAARAGKPLTVVDDQIGSPTFTLDLADVTLDLIDRGATGIYHATNSGQTTWFEFAKAIFEEFEIRNVDLKPISSAKWKEMRPASAIRPAYSVLDCSETEKLIGRPMPHWREALHRYRRVIEDTETADGRG